MYDWDRFGRNNPIGEVIQRLEDVDLLTGETITSALKPMGQRGELLFSMVYNDSTEQYTMTLEKAINLYPMDLNGSSDPYVKVWRYNDKKRVQKCKTKIYHNTLDVNFTDKPFMFHCYFSDIPVTHFEISVMDHDKFGGNDLIGTIVLGGKQGIEVEREAGSGYVTLMKEMPLFRGELSLSLLFKRSYLKVTLHNAKDLLGKDLSGLSDPYVKIWLYWGGEKIMKLKTKVYKETLNPVFDEEPFLFPLRMIKPNEYHLEVFVNDWDRFGGNDQIGMAVLGMCGSDGEKEHWLDAFMSRNEITRTHNLKAQGVDM